MLKQANITISQVVEVNIDKRMTNEELRETIINKVKDSIATRGLDTWLNENTVEYCVIDEDPHCR